MVYGHDSVARKMGMKPVLCLQQSCVDLFQLLYRLYSCGRLWNVAWMLHCRWVWKMSYFNAGIVTSQSRRGIRSETNK